MQFGIILQFKKGRGNAEMLSIEKETTIYYNQKEREANIDTANPAFIKRLDRLCCKFPEEFRCVRRGEDSTSYIVPKKYVCVRAPRIYTTEQRERICEQLSEAREHIVSRGRR